MTPPPIKGDYVARGFQHRRHLWKSGWSLGCDYPGKTSYLRRAAGLFVYAFCVCYWRWAYRDDATARGWGWQLPKMIWGFHWWDDWDSYAPREFPR